MTGAFLKSAARGAANRIVPCNDTEPSAASPNSVLPTDDNPDRAALRALELAMREVLEGMEELTLQVAYAHADHPLPILDPAAADPAPPRPTADVIPFPRLRRAAGE